MVVGMEAVAVVTMKAAAKGAAVVVAVGLVRADLSRTFS